VDVDVDVMSGIDSDRVRVVLVGDNVKARVLTEWNAMSSNGARHHRFDVVGCILDDLYLVGGIE